MLRYDFETREYCEWEDVKNLLKGFLTYVEDGNVVEIRPCGFIDEIKEVLDIS